MKKILSIVLAAMMMALCFVGCAQKDKEFDSDMAYVKDKGVLLVGITDFAPMDYKDENGKWIGFDADMATKFAEELGVKVEFVELADWGKKIMELDDYQVDCVWNGMTLNDEVLKGMETTKPYCKNQQVVVVKKDVADKYTTKESLKDLSFAVEDGSAGQDIVEEQADAEDFRRKVENNVYATRQRAEEEQARILKSQEELARLEQRLVNELSAEDQKNNLALRDSINNFLKEYNKTHGYDLILSKMADNILLGSESLDITKEVIDGLNNRYKEESK